MSEEEEAVKNLKAWRERQAEATNNLRVLGRRQSKSDKVKTILSQAIAECGEGKDLQEVRNAIGIAISKLNQSSKKTFQKFETNKQMVEEAKTKQKKWWDSIQAGLGINKTNLEIPEFKKEIENDVE